MPIDRTDEFFRVAEKLKSDAPVAVHRAPPARSQQTALRTEFTRRAQLIGKGVQNTTAKLQKLTKLAQRKSLFDDPAAEIEELTYVIKQDIQQLNTDLAALGEVQERQKSQGSAQTNQHSGGVVASLKSKLMNTTQQFKDVLMKRTENVKAQQDRRSNFSSNKRGRGSGPLFGDNKAGGSNNGGGGDAVIDMTQFGDRGQTFEQQQLIRGDNYHAQRADAVESIGSTIVSISEIFTQLATMVSEQGDMVERIDENLTDSVENVEEAHGQLLQYMNSISSNRGLILKIFGVMIIFIVLFVLVA